MRVNLQANPYGVCGTYNHTLYNTSFQGKKLNNSDKPNNVVSLYSSSTDEPQQDEFDYQNELDEAYEDGYRDGKKFKGFLMGAGMAFIAFLQALGIYGDLETRNSLMEYQNAQNQYLEDSLERKIEILSQDMHLEHEAIASTLADIKTLLDELNEQKNNLIQQINALPEDSAEAQELKEELQILEEQYKIIEKKYQEFMSEYLKQRGNDNEDNNNQNESKPASPDNVNIRSLPA